MVYMWLIFKDTHFVEPGVYYTCYEFLVVSFLLPLIEHGTHHRTWPHQPCYPFVWRYLHWIFIANPIFASQSSESWSTILRFDEAITYEVLSLSIELPILFVVPSDIVWAKNHIINLLQSLSRVNSPTSLRCIHILFSKYR